MNGGDKDVLRRYCRIMQEEDGAWSVRLIFVLVTKAFYPAPGYQNTQIDWTHSFGVVADIFRRSG